MSSYISPSTIAMSATTAATTSCLGSADGGFAASATLPAPAADTADPEGVFSTF